jgi:regulator of replication initiation timing
VDSLEQQLSNTTSTLSQTQTELAETRQQLAETLSENANLKASLDVTSQKAELFSQNLAQQKREALMAQAVREGIPTAMVEQVFSMAAKFGGNEIKLSNGQNGTADDWAMETLRSLPMESRVQFGQVGHKLSMDAGSNAQTIYGDFMPSQKQAQ